MKFRSILCPVDFSVESRAALRYAIDAARRFGGRLTVMFVHDPLLLAAAKRLRGGRRELIDRTRKELARFVDASGSTRSLRAGTIAIVASTGCPPEQILREARRLRSDLVVLGTHGLSGVRKLFFGSTAAEILARATIPVLAVPPSAARRVRATLDITRVVAPIDLAGEWESDAVRAGAVAKAFDAELLLIHVLARMQRPPWFASGDGAADRRRIDRAARALERVRATLFADRRSACTVLVGDAAEEIARIAGRQPSLVVMSLRGAAGVWGARRGSIAYSVLTHASTPMLALPRRRLGGPFAVRAAHAIDRVLRERDRMEIAGIDALLSLAGRR
jgi:nucleotide-binding universal stress UspA family protein